LGVKRPGRKADHSRLSSAEVQNFGSCCLHTPSGNAWVKGLDTVGSSGQVQCCLHCWKHAQDTERPTCCCYSVSDVRGVLLLDSQYNLQLESHRPASFSLPPSFLVSWNLKPCLPNTEHYITQGCELQPSIRPTVCLCVRVMTFLIENLCPVRSCLFHSPHPQ
jgi:hypothetical protein